MDTITELVSNIRHIYIKSKLEKDINSYKNAAIQNLKISPMNPIFKETYINGEQEVIKSDVQNIVEEIGVDLITLDKCFMQIAYNSNELLTNTISSINNAKTIANKSQRVLDNINKICSYYTSFDTVISCDSSCFTGSYGIIDDNTFCCEPNSGEIVDISIIDINGPGTELTKRSNLIDGDELSYFDYIGIEENKDITFIAELASEKDFNLLKVYTNKPLKITFVSTSDDGLLYTDILKKDINVNGDDVLVNGNSYGLGLVAKPKSRFAKIGFTSSEYVRVNDIKTVAASYNTSATLKSNKIEANNITSVAVYATEYIPDSLLDENCFKYTLTVNGKDYEIQPINSQRNGTKIIKYKIDGSSEDSVTNIEDKITSVELAVTIKTNNTEISPFISNIKICLGAES